MIQRIQTVYLVLALVCMTIFYFVPFGSVTVQSEAGIEDISLGLYGADFSVNGELEHFSSLPLLILLSFVALIIVATIFLYKHRILQIRMCIFNAVLSLGCSGLSFFYLYQASEKYGTDFSSNVLVVLPIVAAIFIILALRSIAKDEALVRSIDRIR